MLSLMTSFMLVRHPFIRLVSAYEDKMLNPRPGLEYHKNVQTDIKRKRRKNENYEIVFPKHLLIEEKYQIMMRKKVTSMKTLMLQPSFEEFISWILENRARKKSSPSSWMKDKTWTPFYSVCPVCQVDYSVIKLDSEGDEMNTWIESVGLNLTSSQAHTRGGVQSSTKRALDYFSQLTKDQVEELYIIYRLDFLLFSYKPDEFLFVAKESNFSSKLLERARIDQNSQINHLNEVFSVKKQRK